MGITTSDRGTQRQYEEAAALARALGVPLVRRRDRDRSTVGLIVGRDGLALEHSGRRFPWHEGMLHALRSAGAAHPLVRHTGLQVGDTVFNCTLGMGTESRFLSEYTGTRVVACELQPLVFAWTRAGLAKVEANVEVRLGDCMDHLRALPDNSFDMVMADPMFPKAELPEHASPALDCRRGAGHAAPFGEDWLAEGQRVARRVVVAKDAERGAWLERLGCQVVVGRKGRGARYGIF